MTDTRLGVVVAVVVVCFMFAGGVAVAQEGGTGTQQQTATASNFGGEPSLSAHAPRPVVSPGERSELPIQIANDGEIDFGIGNPREAVTTARNVRVRVDGDDTPITVDSGRQAVGSITENEPREFPIAIRVPDDIEPGSYTLDVNIRYSYTAQIAPRSGVTQERSRSVTRSVTIRVDDSPRFSVTDLTTDAQIGDRGVMEATVENIGSETANNTRLTLESTSPMVSFGGSTAESASAGTLAPGESTVVRYDITTRPEASVRDFAFDGTVQFTDSDGISGVDEGLSTSVEPAEKQRFSFENVESTLRVGEDGDIHGTVRNDGPSTANSVVVQFADQSPNVVPIESSIAVGTLEPGETGEFRLPIELTRETEAVPRNFDMAVAYRNQANERRLFEDIDISADVEERRDEFLLDIDDRELAAGDSRLLDVRVTNNLDETVSDIEAKLFTDGPISSDDDEGYVESLEPGETTTVTFQVSADDDATPRTYPLQMDFRYDDSSGTSKVSDTYRTALDVTESDADDGPPWLLAGGAVLIVAVLLAVLYWRRS